MSEEVRFDPAAMGQAAQKIDAAYMDELMNALVRFAREGGQELGLNDSQVANVLASACALVAVNLNMPKGTDPATFAKAMKEAVPRLYDAMFSMRDWFDRKMPWRMQSTHMKKAQAQIIGDLRGVEMRERKFDA